MIDFKEKARISKLADKTLNNILMILLTNMKK